MNKKVLEKLLAVMKETSPQDLWAQVKVLEEKLEDMEGSVEDMEQLVVDMLAEEAAEGEKSLEEANVVAKEKGLPLAEGNLVRKYLGLSFNASVEQPKTKGVRGKKSPKDYSPTDEELTKINELSNIDLSKEQVYVFTLRSAGQDIDRSFDQFTAKALKDMAEMSKDKPFLRDHNWDTSSVIGKIFDATVQNKQLVQKVYVPITEKNSDMIEGIMSGIYNKVSVGFGMEPMEYVCSSCNKSLYSRDCAHYPGNKDASGSMVIGQIKGVSDYFEISNVAVPAQPAAGIRRSLPQTKSMEDPILITSPEDLQAQVEEKGGTESLDFAFLSTSMPTAEQINEMVQKALDAPIDKILNDNSDGEHPVENELELPVVEQKEVEMPSEPAPAQEPEVVEESPLQVILAKLQGMEDEIASLKASMKAEKESEVEETTEELVRQLAATTVTPASPSVDFTKPGWSKAIAAALTQQPNQ